MNITFTLSVEQTNIIMKHLGGGAYVEVSPVIAELQRQAAPQLAVPQPPPPPDAAPEGVAAPVPVPN